MRTFRIYWRACCQPAEGYEGRFFFNTDKYPNHALYIRKDRLSSNFISKGREPRYNQICHSCMWGIKGHVDEHKPLCPGKERLYLEVDLSDNRDWNQYPEFTVLNPVSVRENNALITTLSNSSSQIERMARDMLARGYEEFECKIEYPSQEILKYNRGYVYYEKFSKYN